MAETPAETMRRVATLMRARSRRAGTRHRADDQWFGVVADFLDACGNELADVNGNVQRCDEPGAIQTAQKIAGAYLGEARDA